MEPIKYKNGDVVDFVGKVHYTRPTGKVYFSVKPGVAKVLSVIDNADHPIYLQAEPNSTSNVSGWVNIDTIKGIHQEPAKVEIVSYSKSKIVKMASAKDTETGIEITAIPWQDQEWTAVYRPRDPKLAERIAHMAEIGCAKRNFSNIFVAPTTLAEICLEAVEISMDVTKANLIASGLFYCFESEYYLTQFRYLRRGDILLGKTNSAIILSNGPASSEQKPAVTKVKEISKNEKSSTLKVKSVKKNEAIKKIAENKPEQQDNSLTGTYISITPASIRQGAGTDKGTFIIAPKGLTMQNYGFYTVDPKTKVKWLYMQTEYKGVAYNGFVSEKCVVKK